MATVTLKALTKKLDNFANGKAIEEAVTKSCLLVEREAKNNCPVDTGALRRSIETNIESGSNSVTGEIFSPLDYATWIHQGTGLFAANGDGRKDVPWHYQDEEGNWHSTSGQKPNPFLERALDENKDKCIDYFKEAIKEGLK